MFTKVNVNLSIFIFQITLLLILINLVMHLKFQKAYSIIGFSKNLKYLL